MPWSLRLYLAYLPFLMLASFYVGWRLVVALRSVGNRQSNKVWILVTAAMVYLNLHILLQLLFYFVGPDSWLKAARAGHFIWDMLFTYPFWIYLIVIVELVPIILVFDLGVFIVRHTSGFGTRLAKWRDILVLLSALLLISYTTVRSIVDNQRIVVSKESLVIPELSRDLDGLRIVHISDVQADAHTGTKELSRYFNVVNSLDPDLVFFTGDLITSGTDYIELGARAMGGLHTRLGVYACIGDHDIWSSRELVVNALKKQHIPVIENRNISIAAGEGADSLLVTFITNTYSERIQKHELTGLLQEKSSNTPRILVVHQPAESLVRAAESSGYDLFLGGHTHGGQVVLKPLGFTLTPALRETRFFKGFYRSGEMMISINSGLGYTLAPVRYRAPAEISLIELVCQ
jgi:predicted MPP superfamily phosphohydrolase